MNYKKIFFLPTILLMIAGCSLLSPVQTDTTSYVINSVPSVCSKHASRHATIYVGAVKTDTVYNTTQMAYSTHPYQIAYYAKNSWASTPSQMLQPLIVKTLQNSHQYRSVISPPTVAHYDYLLNVQIDQLLQDYTINCGVLRLEMRVQLINAVNNRVIASKHICIMEPLPQQSPYGGVYAANRATARALWEIAEFCASKITH